MPDARDLALFALVALPGLTGLALFQSLTSTRRHPVSEQVVGAVLLSMLSYVALAALERIIPSLPSPELLLKASSDDLGSLLSRETLEVVGLAWLIAVALSLIWVFVTAHEWLHRICRRIGITRRSGFETHWDSVWDSVASAKGKCCWVALRMTDGDCYIGALESHSDASDERSVLLCQVAKIKCDGTRTDWGEEDLLYIPDISAVRSFRLHFIAKEESHDEAVQPKAWRRWVQPGRRRLWKD